MLPTVTEGSENLDQKQEDIVISPLLKGYKEILAHLLPLLFDTSEGRCELLVEVLRAFGNYSRFAVFRQVLVATRAAEALVVRIPILLSITISPIFPLVL